MLSAKQAGASSTSRRGRRWSRGGAGMAAYTIAKAGVAALTVALAEEVAKDGILVNAVAPSIMDTPANRKAMPKADFDAWPKVEEVAATIVFLASPDNASPAAPSCRFTGSLSSRPGRAKREPGSILRSSSIGYGVWIPACAGTTVD